MLTQLKYSHTWHLHEPRCCGHLLQDTRLHTRVSWPRWYNRGTGRKATGCSFWRHIKKGFCIHCLLNKSCIYKEQNSVLVMNEKYFLKTIPPYFKTEDIIPCCFLLLFMHILCLSFLLNIFGKTMTWICLNIAIFVTNNQDCCFEPRRYSSGHFTLFSNSKTYFLHDPEEPMMSLCLFFYPQNMRNNIPLSSLCCLFWTDYIAPGLRCG